MKSVTHHVEIAYCGTLREGDPKGWSLVLVTALGSVLGKPVPAATEIKTIYQWTYRTVLVADVHYHLCAVALAAVLFKLHDGPFQQLVQKVASRDERWKHSKTLQSECAFPADVQNATCTLNSTLNLTGSVALALLTGTAEY
jgi:hypothetical protein